MHPCAHGALLAVAAVLGGAATAALVVRPYAAELDAVRSEAAMSKERVEALQAEKAKLHRRIAMLEDVSHACLKSRDAERRERASKFLCADSPGGLLSALANGTVPTRQHRLSAPRAKAIRARRLKRLAQMKKAGGRTRTGDTH